MSNESSGATEGATVARHKRRGGGRPNKGPSLQPDNSECVLQVVLSHQRLGSQGQWQQLSSESKSWIQQLAPVLSIYDYDCNDILDLVSRCEFDQAKIQAAVDAIYEEKNGREENDWQVRTRRNVTTKKSTTPPSTREKRQQGTVGDKLPLSFENQHRRRRQHHGGNRIEKHQLKKQENKEKLDYQTGSAGHNELKNNAQDTLQVNLEANRVIEEPIVTQSAGVNAEASNTSQSGFYTTASTSSAQQAPLLPKQGTWAGVVAAAQSKRVFAHRKSSSIENLQTTGSSTVGAVKETTCDNTCDSAEAKERVVCDDSLSYNLVKKLDENSEDQEFSPRKVSSHSIGSSPDVYSQKPHHFPEQEYLSIDATEDAQLSLCCQTISPLTATTMTTTAQTSSSATLSEIPESAQQHENELKNGTNNAIDECEQNTIDVVLPQGVRNVTNVTNLMFGSLKQGGGATQLKPSDVAMNINASSLAVLPLQQSPPKKDFFFSNETKNNIPYEPSVAPPLSLLTSPTTAINALEPVIQNSIPPITGVSTTVTAKPSSRNIVAASHGQCPPPGLTGTESITHNLTSSTATINTATNIVPGNIEPSTIATIAPATAIHHMNNQLQSQTATASYNTWGYYTGGSSATTATGTGAYDNRQPATTHPSNNGELYNFSSSRRIDLGGHQIPTHTNRPFNEDGQAYHNGRRPYMSSVRSGRRGGVQQQPQSVGRIMNNSGSNTHLQQRNVCTNNTPYEMDMNHNTNIPYYTNYAIHQRHNNDYRGFNGRPDEYELQQQQQHSNNGGRDMMFLGSKSSTAQQQHSTPPPPPRQTVAASTYAALNTTNSDLQYAPYNDIISGNTTVGSEHRLFPDSQRVSGTQSPASMTNHHQQQQQHVADYSGNAHESSRAATAVQSQQQHQHCYVNYSGQPLGMYGRTASAAAAAAAALGYSSIPTANANRGNIVTQVNAAACIPSTSGASTAPSSVAARAAGSSGISTTHSNSRSSNGTATSGGTSTGSNPTSNTQMQASLFGRNNTSPYGVYGSAIPTGSAIQQPREYPATAGGAHYGQNYFYDNPQGSTDYGSMLLHQQQSGYPPARTQQLDPMYGNTTVYSNAYNTAQYQNATTATMNRHL